MSGDRSSDRSNSIFSNRFFDHFWFESCKLQLKNSHENPNGQKDVGQYLGPLISMKQRSFDGHWWISWSLYKSWKLFYGSYCIQNQLLMAIIASTKTVSLPSVLHTNSSSIHLYKLLILLFSALFRNLLWPNDEIDTFCRSYTRTHIQSYAK